MKIFLNSIFLLLIIYASSITRARAADGNEINLSTEDSQAVINALDRFRADGFKSDGYNISIDRNSNGIEVVFVPALMKSKNLIGVAPSQLMEVHYYLDGSGLKVLRRLYGQ